jgi:hypothetical protein
MYSLIKYLTGSKTKKPENPEQLEAQPISLERTEVKNCTRNNRCNKKSTVYLVIEKETQNPLGIFDSIEGAKQNGQKITHYNCIIVPFRINDPCKYLYNPVFEDR